VSLSGKVLVTGGTGLLGSRLSPWLKERGWDVVVQGREHGGDVQCDLTDPSAVQRLIGEVRPAAVVQLVSLTNVDLCERDPHLAYLVNVRSVENIVAALDQVADAHLVHISTDHIYDAPGANREDALMLRNTYALTKLWAERIAMDTPATVLRTNFFGRSHLDWRGSFSDWVAKAMTDPESVTLLTDVMFSPLSIETLSDVITRSLSARPAGIFNAGSREGLSKRDFAHLVAKTLGGSMEGAKDGRQSDLTLDAARPAAMMMDSSKLEAALGITLPTLTKEIETAEL